MGQWRGIAVGVAMWCAASPLSSQRSIADALLTSGRSAGLPAADSGVAQPAATLEGVLHNAFARAAVVFTGEVVSIDRTQDAVSIQWKVKDAVSGATAGTVYEQREWAGLWTDGTTRYQVGERALVLLHAPSAAGYASPVEDGVIPLCGDAITGSLDLRWMASQVAVTDAARLRPMLALRAAGGNFGVSDGLMQRSRSANSILLPRNFTRLPLTNTGESTSAVVLNPPSTPASTDDGMTHVDGAMILGMLHAWQRAGQTGQ